MVRTVAREMERTLRPERSWLHGESSQNGRRTDAVLSLGSPGVWSNDPDTLSPGQRAKSPISGLTIDTSGQTFFRITSNSVRAASASSSGRYPVLRPDVLKRIQKSDQLLLLFRRKVHLESLIVEVH
jgi:hypothetical protein